MRRVIRKYSLHHSRYRWVQGESALARRRYSLSALEELRKEGEKYTCLSTPLSVAHRDSHDQVARTLNFVVALMNHDYIDKLWVFYIWQLHRVSTQHGYFIVFYILKPYRAYPRLLEHSH